MAMRMLVTGANGFVGRVLVAQAARAGWTVRAAVRDLARAGHIDGAADTVALDLGRGDPAPAVDGADVIVHLAARVHVMRDRAADPLAAFREANVAATERLAAAAVRAGVRRFVFVSSVKVHGDERDEPYREDEAPRPSDAYGQSKLEAEEALTKLGARSALGVCIVRPPLVYGPGVKANFLALLRAVDRGIPLPFAAIRNRRSMVYVGNFADALLACAVNPSAVGRKYLVSDGVDFSTPDLLKAVGAALGKAARLWPLPPSAFAIAGSLPPVSGVVRRLTGSLSVDSSRIRAELGWVPPFTAAAGLQATVNWFRSIS